MTTESFSAGIANTQMSDRDLLIHAVQHLEDQCWRIERMEAQLAEIHAELAVFRPLLREIAPDGKVSLTGLLRARRGAGQHAEKTGPTQQGRTTQRMWGG